MSEFLLKTEPTDIIVFESEKLGEEAVTVNLKITNPTEKDLVYKVKCTSNEMFRIRPPMGILQPSKNEFIRLVFNSGKTIPENRKHYFAVYYINKSENSAAASKGARELWADHTGNPDGTRRLYVEFKLIQGTRNAEDRDAKKEGETSKKEEKVDTAAPSKETEEKRDEKMDTAAPNVEKDDKKTEKVEAVVPKKEEKKDEMAAMVVPNTEKDEKKTEKEKDEKK